MHDLQKMGGAAALVEAVTYLVGIALLVTALAPAMGLPPTDHVAFLVEHQTLMHLWHLTIYLINGSFLVVLVLALHERLRGGAPALAPVATAFGLIWAGLVLASGMLIINDLRVITEIHRSDPARAALLWQALSAVEDGLGGGVELPGGLWMLLVSLAARRGGLPRPLNIAGVLFGAAGILTALPALGELGALFGLGAIAWFIGVGVTLWRTPSPVAAPSHPAPQLPRQHSAAS